MITCLLHASNNDTPAFFEQLNNYMLNRNTDYALITGDYNITFDPKLDSQNYTTLTHNFLNLISTLDHQVICSETIYFNWMYLMF